MRIGLRFAVLILAGAACSSLGLNFREPDIQLDHAVVPGIDLTGGNLDLVVKVQNPNNFAVSENGTTTITLPLRFGRSGIGSAVRAALRGRAPLTRAGTVAIPGVGPS